MKTTVQTSNETRGDTHAQGRIQGQTVDRVDQVSSVTLLGLAIVGAALAVGLSYLTH